MYGLMRGAGAPASTLPNLLRRQVSRQYTQIKLNRRSTDLELTELGMNTCSLIEVDIR
jgi:hypothetical protein